MEIRNQPQAERLNMKYNLTRRLYEKKFNKEQITKLFLFLDWLIHLPKGLEIKYQESLYQFEEAKKMAYVSSIERMGIEKGRQEGRQTGRQEGEMILLIRLLNHKFGALTPKFKLRIKAADIKTLQRWADRLLEATSIDEVFAE